MTGLRRLILVLNLAAISAGIAVGIWIFHAVTAVPAIPQ